jgi:hypothetical protein
MANASEPQTDRELLLSLNNQVNSIKEVFDGKIDMLAESIDRLNKTYLTLEEKRVYAIEQRMDSFDKWKNQITGGWKFAWLIWGVAGAAIIGIVIAFFKWMISKW